jgi:hypothetical protein
MKNDGLSSEARYNKRLEKSKPVLDEYHQWLVYMKKEALPKGKLGEAVNYSLNQWDKLSSFMEDGGIAIDNNLALYADYFYPHLLYEVS